MTRNVLSINTSSLTEMVSLVERLRPDLTVIGPELPLVLGLADELRSRGFAVVGPGREAARLEGSESLRQGISCAALDPNGEDVWRG